MDTLKFATFGCWNKGCVKGSGQEKVIEELFKKQEEYKFLILLGDNYYSSNNEMDYELDGKKQTVKFFDVNLEEMKNGFNCLSNINIPKKIILGNHDIEEGQNQGCMNMKSQLNLPWYDIKFPFGYENHFIFINKNNPDLKMRSYKLIKFIYLDTTIYSYNGKRDTCYERLLLKTPQQLISEQRVFIKKQIKSLDPKITNTVVFIGHEPLLPFKFKNKNEKDEYPASILSLLNDIYKLTEKLDKSIQLHYICADFHNFEEGYITKPYYNGNMFKIHQLIFGTGGNNNLDDRYNPDINRTNPKNFNGFFYDMQHRYGSNKPLLDYSINPLKTFGYGEIIIDEFGLTYNFISTSNETSEWKNKYLKYKNKYLKHNYNL